MVRTVRALSAFGVMMSATEKQIAAAEERIKAFITVGFGRLAQRIKDDIQFDRAQLEQLRERVVQLEQRFNMVNGHQGGRIGGGSQSPP